MYSRETPLWANVYHSYQTGSIFERQARNVRQASVRSKLKKVNSTLNLALFDEIINSAKGKDAPFFKEYIVGKIQNDTIIAFLQNVDRMIEYIKSLFVDQTIDVKIPVRDIKPFTPVQIGAPRPTYKKKSRRINILDLRKEIEDFMRQRDEWYKKRSDVNTATKSGLVVSNTSKPSKKKSVTKSTQKKPKPKPKPLSTAEKNKLRILEAESIQHYVDTKDISICSSIDGRVGTIEDSQYVQYEQDKQTKHYYRVSGKFKDSNILINEEGDALIRHTLKVSNKRERYDRFGSVHKYRFDTVGENIKITGSDPDLCNSVRETGDDDTSTIKRNAITIDANPKTEESILSAIRQANVESDELEKAYRDWTKHIWRKKNLQPKLLQMNVLLHASNEDIVIAHKPGAGKTVNSVLLAEMKRNAAIKFDPANKSLRILVVAPKTQLLQQWQDTVIEWGFNPGNWAFQTVAHFRMSLLSSNYTDYNDLNDSVKNNFRKNMWVWSDEKKEFVFKAPDVSSQQTMDVNNWVFHSNDNYPRRNRKQIQQMMKTWVKDVVHHKYVQSNYLKETVAEKRCYMSKNMYNYFFENRDSDKHIEQYKDSLLFAIDIDKKEIHVLADLMWSENGPIPLSYEDQSKKFVKQHNKWLEDFRRKIDVCLMKKYGRRGKVLDTPFELIQGYGTDGVIDVSNINELQLFLKQIQPFDKDTLGNRWVKRSSLGTVRTYIKEKTHGPRLSCHLYNMEKNCIFILDEAHETVSNSNILTNRLLFDFCRFTHSNILVTATPLMSANYRQKLIMFSKLLNRKKSDYDFLTESDSTVPEGSESTERFRIALSKLNNKITRAFTKSAIERDKFIDSLGEDFFSPVSAQDIHQDRAQEILNSTQTDEDKSKELRENIQSLIALPDHSLLRNRFGAWETKIQNMSLKELGKVYVMLSQKKEIEDRLDAYPNSEFVQDKLVTWKTNMLNGAAAVKTEIEAIYNMLPERESAVDKLMRQFMHNNPVKWNLFYSSKSEYGITRDYKIAIAKNAMESLIKLEEGQIEVDPNVDLSLVNYSLYDILDKRLNRFPTKAPLYNSNFVGRPGYYQVEMDEPLKKVQYGMNVTIDYARRYTGSGSNLKRVHFFKTASEALRQNFPDKPEFVPLIVAMNVEVSYEKDIPDDATLESYTTKTLRYWCKIYKLGVSGRKNQLLDKLKSRRAENRKQCKPIDEECEQAMGMLQDYAYRYSYDNSCLMIPILVNENIVNPLVAIDLDNPDIYSLETLRDLLYYCFPPGDKDYVVDSSNLDKWKIVRQLKTYDHEKSLEEDDELNERVQVEARQHLTKFLLEKYDASNPTAPATNYNMSSRRSSRTDAFTNKNPSRASYLEQCEKEYSTKKEEDRLTWKHLREGNSDGENTIAYVPDVLSSKIQKIVTFIEQQVAEDKNVIVYDSSIEVLKAIENGLIMRKNKKLNLYDKNTGGNSLYRVMDRDNIHFREDILNEFKTSKYKKWKKWEEAYRKRDKAFMLNDLPYETDTIPARSAYYKSPIIQEATEQETQMFNKAMVHAFESLETNETAINSHLGLMSESLMDEKVEFIKKVSKSKIEWCKRLKYPAYRPNKEGQWLTEDEEYYTEDMYENTDGEKQGITIADKYDYAYYMVDPFVKMKVKSKTRGIGSSSAYFKDYSVELKKVGATRGKSNLLKALAYMKSYHIYFKAIDLTVVDDINSYIELALLMSKRLYAVKSIQSSYRDSFKKDVYNISVKLEQCSKDTKYPDFLRAAKAFFVYQIRKILDKESPLLTKDIRDNIVDSEGANVLYYVTKDHDEAEDGEVPSEKFMSWVVNSKKSSQLFTGIDELASYVGSLRVSFNDKLKRKLKAVDDELLQLFPWGEYPRETNLPTNIEEVVSWAYMVLGNLFKQRKLEFLATLGAKKTELTLSDRDRNIWFSAGEKEQLRNIQEKFLDGASMKLKKANEILKLIENAKEKEHEIQSDLSKIYEEIKDMKHAWRKCSETKKILKQLKREFKAIKGRGDRVWYIDVREYIIKDIKDISGPELMEELHHVFKVLANIDFDPTIGRLSDNIFDLYGEDYTEFKVIYNEIYGTCDDHFSKALEILQRKRVSLEKQLDLATNGDDRKIETHRQKAKLEEGISAMKTSAKNFKIEMIKYIVEHSDYVESMIGEKIDGSDDLTDIPPRFHIVKKYMASLKVAYVKTNDKEINKSLQYNTYKHESDERLIHMLDDVEGNPEWGNHKHNLLINDQEYLDDIVKVVSYSKGTNSVTRQGIIKEQVPSFQQEGTVVKLLSGKVRVRIGDKENIYPKSKIKETKLMVGMECTVTQDDFWKVKFDGTNMEKDVSRKDMQGLSAKTKLNVGKKVTIKFEDESLFYKGRGETVKYKHVFPRPIIHPNTQERLEMFKKDDNGEDVLEQGLKGTYLDTRGKDSILAVRNRVSGMIENKVKFGILTAKDAPGAPKRDVYKAAFECGLIDCLLMNRSSITGIDFTSSKESVCIMVSPTQLGISDQFVGRLVRRNSHEVCPPEFRRVQYVSFTSVWNRGVNEFPNSPEDESDTHFERNNRRAQNSNYGRDDSYTEEKDTYRTGADSSFVVDDNTIIYDDGASPNTDDDNLPSASDTDSDSDSDNDAVADEMEKQFAGQAYNLRKEKSIGKLYAKDDDYTPDSDGDSSDDDYDATTVRNTQKKIARQKQVVRKKRKKEELWVKVTREEVDEKTGEKRTVTEYVRKEKEVKKTNKRIRNPDGIQTIFTDDCDREWNPEDDIGGVNSRLGVYLNFNALARYKSHLFYTVYDALKSDYKQQYGFKTLDTYWENNEMPPRRVPDNIADKFWYKDVVQNKKGLWEASNKRESDLQADSVIISRPASGKLLNLHRGFNPDKFNKDLIPFGYTCYVCHAENSDTAFTCKNCGANLKLDNGSPNYYKMEMCRELKLVDGIEAEQYTLEKNKATISKIKDTERNRIYMDLALLSVEHNANKKEDRLFRFEVEDYNEPRQTITYFQRVTDKNYNDPNLATRDKSDLDIITMSDVSIPNNTVPDGVIQSPTKEIDPDVVESIDPSLFFEDEADMPRHEVRLSTGSLASLFGFVPTPVNEKNNPNQNFILKNVIGDGNCLYYSFLQSLSELYRKNRSLIPEEFRMSNGLFMYNIDFEENMGQQRKKVTMLRSRLATWFQANWYNPVFDSIPTEKLPKSTIRTKQEVLESINAGIGSRIPLKAWGDTDVIVLLMVYFKFREKSIGVNIFNRDENRWDVNNHSKNLNEAPSKYNIYLWYTGGNHYKWLQCLAESCVMDIGDNLLDIESDYDSDIM